MKYEESPRSFASLRMTHAPSVIARRGDSSFHSEQAPQSFSLCHCEERGDEAISMGSGIATHLSGARNDNGKGYNPLISFLS